MWMTYEAFFADPAGATTRMLELHGLEVQVESIQHALAGMDGKPTRKNVGISGRGVSLPARHRAAVRTLAKSWGVPYKEMARIGLG